MTRRHSLAVLLVTVWATAALAAGQGVKVPAGKAGLPAASLEALHQMVRPQKGEAPWATIPWLIHVDEARRRAVAEDKPILVYRAGAGETLGRA